jgi:cysteine desulfurase
MSRLIYLDHAATTALDPATASGLAERQATLFGNPASTHPVGRAAGKALAEARSRIARRLGGDAKDLIFTGGGTEALYLAILGSAGETPGHLLYSAVEHSAVRESAAMLAARGWTVEVVPVDVEGRVTPQAVAARLRPDTRILAVMLANNEIGTINDVPGIARVLRAQCRRARLVVDAVQAFGKLPFTVAGLDADCVAITGHKLHGPKGIGALWSRVTLRPVMKGGGQEGGVRGGTQSAPLAWAFAEAADRHLDAMHHVEALRDDLWARLSAGLPTARLTGPALGPDRLGNNLHLCVPGLPSEPLLNALSAAGVCCSAGSACSAGKFSKVLTALGRRKEDGAYIRLSPGRFTTTEDITTAARVFLTAVEELRQAYG